MRSRVEGAQAGSSPLARGLRQGGDRGQALAGIIPARAGFTAASTLCRTRSWDHPRSRGVYLIIPLIAIRVAGSSPLARGLRVPRRGRAARHGIIPARAGFTVVPRTSAMAWRDHPRSRGVYAGSPDGVAWDMGSSPLARGLLHFGLTSLGMTRIIPARAGFTPTTCPTTWASSDHPRSRGVYSVIGVLTGIVAGSSPLARGLPLGGVVDRVRDRIIPARAGFTSPPGTCGPGGTDHPRSRGVYEMNESASSSQLGSSPLARGLHVRGTRPRILIRIIPARAGFTGRRSRTTRWSRDHPRSRGVYGPVGDTGAGHLGSSPLARGLRGAPGHAALPRGIIPARAGFTCWRAGLVRRRLDHPRSRGVYDGIEQTAKANGGSSPLARGLRPGSLRGRAPVRIIPARAGFTSRHRRREARAGGSSPLARGLHHTALAQCHDTHGSSPLARGLRLAILGIPTITHPTRRLPPSLLT